MITKIPAKSRCNECGTEYEHDRFQMLCTNCGSMNVELLQGRELKIDSIEADTGEDETDAEPALAPEAPDASDPPESPNPADPSAPEKE